MRLKIRRNKILVPLLVISIGLISSCRKDQQEALNFACYTHTNETTSAFFLNDAEYLAQAQIAGDSTHPAYNDWELDPVTVAYYLEKLSIIYKAAEDPSSELYDIIFRYKSQTELEKSAKRMIVGFSNNSPGHLLDNFLTNPGASGNAVLDRLYNDFGFTQIQEMNVDYWLQIRSDKNANISAICRELLKNEWITLVMPGTTYKSGGNGEISAYKDGDMDVIKFTYGWPHSTTGYLVYHSWSIGVDSNCNVTYLGENGYSLPG